MALQNAERSTDNATTELIRRRKEHSKPARPRRAQIRVVICGTKGPSPGQAAREARWRAWATTTSEHGRYAAIPQCLPRTSMARARRQHV